MPSLLHDADVKFLAVDDYHLKAVGIEGEKLLGYFITENNGKNLAIFPISETLRYTMPFAPVEETMAYLRSIADDSGKRLVVFADDGEKFGLWPGTKKWVWDKGWMEKMLTELESNSDWINLINFSDVLEKLVPSGRVYMPTGSYFEMSEWTLPAELSYDFHKFVHHLKETGELERIKPFVKGGFWREFLAKYEESNWMHKRMLWISEQIHSRKRKLKEHTSDAMKSLYRSQCNCAYWHGVFGGLYLPHLREGIWTNILDAENIIENYSPIKPLTTADIDADGQDEIRLSNGELSLWIKPSCGGHIEEISFLPGKVNLINTLSRYKEGYHKLLWEAQHEKATRDEHSSIHDHITVKESGLEDIIHYDWHTRRFAQEHFLLTFTDCERFEHTDYTELGDFINQKYDIIEKYSKKENTQVLLRRDGGIHFEEKNFPLTIEKRIALQSPGNRLVISYEIENKSEWREFLFGVETNFSLLSRDDPQRYFKFPHESLIQIRPGDRKTFIDTDGYEIVDESRKFRVSCRGHFDELWLFPVETVSNSESGFERVYQETAVIHLFRFNLGRNEKFTTEIMWKIAHL